MWAILFGLTLLACALAYGGAVAGWLPPCSKRLLRFFGALVLLLPMLAVGGGVIYNAWLLHQARIPPGWLLPGAIGWTACAVTGVFGLLVLGVRLDPQTRHPRALGWPRRRFVLLGLLSLALSAGVVALAMRDAARQRAAWRTAARAEIDAWIATHVPDPAATPWDQSGPFAALDSKGSFLEEFSALQIKIGKSDYILSSDPIFDVTAAAPQAFLKTWAHLVPLLWDVAAREHLALSIHTAKENPNRRYVAVGSLYHPRQAINLLGLDARSAAEQGDAKRAFQDLTAAFRIADHSSNGPYFVSLSIGTSFSSMTFLLVEDTFYRLSDKSYADALPLFSVRDPDLLRAMTHQIDYLLLVNREWYSGEMQLIRDACTFHSARLNKNPLKIERFTDIRPAGIEYAAWVLDPLWRAFLLIPDWNSYDALMAEQKDILRLPPPQAFRAWRRFHNRMKQKTRGVIARRLMQNDTLLPFAFDAIASRRLCILAKAVMAYRADRGAYPSSLAELVPAYLPAIPLDPFTGKPLKAIAVPGGLTLYSVGPDLTDNKGAQTFRGTADIGDDITFRLGAAYRTKWLLPALQQRNAAQAKQQPTVR